MIYYIKKYSFISIKQVNKVNDVDYLLITCILQLGVPASVTVHPDIKVKSLCLILIQLKKMDSYTKEIFNSYTFRAFINKNVLL